MDADMQELAALDCWAAYSAAAAAIAGTFAADNVPTDRLRFIVETNTHDLIRFGAQIALHQRGADWTCGSTNSEDRRPSSHQAIGANQRMARPGHGDGGDARRRWVLLNPANQPTDLPHLREAQGPEHGSGAEARDFCPR